MAFTQKFDYLFKILLIGSAAVGKSNLLLRFAQNMFDQNSQTTIGVDFKIKTVQHNGSSVKLQIWDTAGQQRYKTIATTYYRGAHGIIIVYDITNRGTFEGVVDWLSEVDKSGNENVVKLLIGNKSDLEEKREVRTEEGRELAEKLGIKFIETSAKEAINVDKTFTTLIEEIMKGNIVNKPKGQRVTAIEPIKPPSSGWSC